MDPRLYGRETKVLGRGLFTHTAVAPGELLMRRGGILIPIADYDKLRYRSTSTSSYDEMHYLTTPIDEPHGLADGRICR